jgi:hypothetical protein
MTSHHKHKSTQLTQNQNNELPDNPAQRGRESFVLGRDGENRPVERSPEEEAREDSPEQIFEEKDAGLAPKE